MGSTEELRFIYIIPKRRNGQQRLGLIYVLVMESNRQLWYICVIILKPKLILLWRWGHEIFAKVSLIIGFISSEHLSMCVTASITWNFFLSYCLTTQVHSGSCIQVNLGHEFKMHKLKSFKMYKRDLVLWNECVHARTWYKVIKPVWTRLQINSSVSKPVLAAGEKQEGIYRGMSMGRVIQAAPSLWNTKRQGPPLGQNAF